MLPPRRSPGESVESRRPVQQRFPLSLGIVRGQNQGEEPSAESTFSGGVSTQPASLAPMKLHLRVKRTSHMGDTNATAAATATPTSATPAHPRGHLRHHPHPRAAMPATVAEPIPPVPPALPPWPGSPPSPPPRSPPPASRPSIPLSYNLPTSHSSCSSAFLSVRDDPPHPDCHDVPVRPLAAPALPRFALLLHGMVSAVTVPLDCHAGTRTWGHSRWCKGLPWRLVPQQRRPAAPTRRRTSRLVRLCPRRLRLPARYGRCRKTRTHQTVQRGLQN